MMTCRQHSYIHRSGWWAAASRPCKWLLSGVTILAILALPYLLPLLGRTSLQTRSATMGRYNESAYMQDRRNWSNSGLTNNTTTVEFVPFIPSSELQKLIDGWFAFSIIIGFAACLLLLFLLSTSFYNESLRRGSRILIIHLLMLQLIICGFNFPILTIQSYMTLAQKEIHIHCPTFLYLDIAITHVENWASTLLALNRYVAIKVPHHYKTVVSKQGLILTIALPWVIGMCDTLPIYLGVGGTFLFVPPYGCNFIPNGDAYGVVWVTIGDYIPITVMGLTYMVLFIQLTIDRHKRRGRHTGEAEDAPGRVREARKIATAKILVASFMWYCLFFLPDVIINTALTYLYGSSFMLHLWLVSLLHIGFAGSTVVFLALGTDYRAGGKRLLLRIWAEVTRSPMPPIGAVTVRRVNGANQVQPRNPPPVKPSPAVPIPAPARIN